jgi:hypothetical protein
MILCRFIIGVAHQADAGEKENNPFRAVIMRPVMPNMDRIIPNARFSI